MHNQKHKNRNYKVKTLKEFVSTHKVEPKQLEKLEVVQEQHDFEPLELVDLPDNLFTEGRESGADTVDPPAVLVMRRKSIRQFPGGKRVALYYVDKLNKYVTVPYTAMQWSSGDSIAEEQVEENVIHHLKHIVDNHSAKSVKFKDGKTMKVDVQTANAVLKVHGALNDINKKKIEDMSHKSKEHFNKVVDFAWKHVTYKK